MIATKTSIRPTSSRHPESVIKDSASISRADAAVQTRAYELYEHRGRLDGHAEQDWYQAEAEVRAGQQTKREL